MNLTSLIEACPIRIEVLFDTFLANKPCPAPQLQEAMRYAVLNGGKRIRPILIYATGLALNGALENLDIPACAIELIHAYSLIHDDLPAMDNSDLRRGKPSCHKAYNEALAILAGDALQPLAFEVIASHPGSLTTDQRLQMVRILAIASGLHGMAGGQALDIAGTTDIDTMYSLKTGALLVASVQLGAIASGAATPNILLALEKYALNLGLAFQIQDDLLDFTHEKTTGKPQGLDLANQKATYPLLHGIEKTRLKITELTEEAVTALNLLGEKAAILRDLATYLLERDR